MEIEAFREYRPAHGKVELTVYWYSKTGEKMRTDFDLPEDFFFDEDGSFYDELTLTFGMTGPMVNFPERKPE